jgi:hypothetical protein
VEAKINAPPRLALVWRSTVENAEARAARSRVGGSRTLRIEYGLRCRTVIPCTS